MERVAHEVFADGKLIADSVKQAWRIVTRLAMAA